MKGRGWGHGHSQDGDIGWGQGDRIQWDGVGDRGWGQRNTGDRVRGEQSDIGWGQGGAVGGQERKGLGSLAGGRG